MNRSVYRDVAAQALWGVQPYREKLVLDRRSRCGACASRLLRTDVGRDSHAGTTSSICYGPPGFPPVIGPFDMAGFAGTYLTFLFMESGPLSQPGKNPKALFVSSDSLNSVYRALVCGKLGGMGCTIRGRNLPILLASRLWHG